ncbi:MAG: AraC family transcriptional regulator [Burkholderiaceae bacterium]|nr:AraC family transcriptional regulator [Burkholderiaceae bacterium]
MSAVHDRASATPARASADDVLSEVLATLRLTGSMLFLVHAARPWHSWAPPAEAFRPLVLPASQHLVSYHIVTCGGCWAGLPGTPPERFDTGDILVVPHGDPYFLADPPDAPRTYDGDEAVRFFRRMAAGTLPTSIEQGDRDSTGERTQFICAFLGCDQRPFNPVLAALPRAMHLRATDAAGDRLRHLVDFAIAELRERSSGGTSVLTRLTELMFIEVVRRHLAALDETSGGWLAGLRDPLVARALSLLHAEPARRWTIEQLAGEAGTSRSVLAERVLAERFTHLVGLPPMHYLTQWRMQRAAQLLAQPGRNKIVAIAQAVGYESEAAFSRAFRKSAGVAPSAWRRQSAA